jgi:hypothetical protein
MAAPPDDSAALCASFEQVALDLKPGGMYFASREFAALRNSVNAYGVLDAKRASAFYRSLLAQPPGAVREAGIYGLGELRVADAVKDLRTVIVPDKENSFSPGSVSLSLGKIGTPEAYDLLESMLLDDPIVVKQSWTVLTVMDEICGRPAKSPPGSWSNGCWASVAEDRATVTNRFAAAMTKLAAKAGDERLAREARGRADSLRRQLKILRAASDP